MWPIDIICNSYPVILLQFEMDSFLLKVILLKTCFLMVHHYQKCFAYRFEELLSIYEIRIINPALSDDQNMQWRVTIDCFQTTWIQRLLNSYIPQKMTYNKIKDLSMTTKQSKTCSYNTYSRVPNNRRGWNNRDGGGGGGWTL